MTDAAALVGRASHRPPDAAAHAHAEPTALAVALRLLARLQATHERCCSRSGGRCDRRCGGSS